MTDQHTTKPHAGKAAAPAATMTEDEAAAARKTRMETAHAHMTNRNLEDRALAYHTHAFDSDEGVATMLADYDRLVAEQAPPPDPPVTRAAAGHAPKHDAEPAHRR